MLDLLSNEVNTLIGAVQKLPVGNFCYKVDLCYKDKLHVFWDNALADMEEMVSWGYSFSETTYSDVVRFLPSLSKPTEIRIQEEGSKKVQKHILRNIWESRTRNDIERLVKLGLPIEADWFEYASLE